MDAETYPSMNSDLSGEVEGIGAVVQTDEKTKAISIAQVLDGSPAETAGLKSGDIFLKVEGSDVTQATQFGSGAAGTCKEGTSVNLDLAAWRQNIGLQNYTRQNHDTPVVESKTSNVIGYIKLQ